MSINDSHFDSSLPASPEDSRWQRFMERFDAFELISPKMAGIWHESDLRKKKLAELERLLSGDLKPPFDEKEILKGLLFALGFFPKFQLEELHHLVLKMGEGLAEERAQEAFEKGSQKDLLDKASRDAIMEAFDHLIQKYFQVIAHSVNMSSDPERLKALINVAWTSIEACGIQLKQAIKSGKSLTEMQLIIFRFEQQLDALDPSYPFLPSQQLGRPKPNA